MSSSSKLLLFSLFTLSCLHLSAKGDSRDFFKKVWSKADDILSERYYRTSYDTNYVVRPEGKWTLKLRVNQTGNTIHAKGTVDDIRTRADLSTSGKTTISIGAAYRGLAASISINPAKLAGKYNDYELNFNYNGSRVSFDVSYQRSKSLAGNIEYDGTSRVEKGDASMETFNIAAFYCFNHRHFSFPAAFSQSFLQRRSAGSWLAGLSYQGGSLKTSEELMDRMPDTPEVSIRGGQYGIGGGYGYNLVLGRKWLFHLSGLPSFVIYNWNKMTINGESERSGRVRFNMLFNERAAIVYNFSPRWFAGATLVMSNSLFDDKQVIVNQNKWVARAFVGLRL